MLGHFVVAETMAEAARIFEDINEAIAAPLLGVPQMPPSVGTPKAIAARLMDAERRKTDGRLGRIKDAITALAAWPSPSAGVREIQERARDLLSAKIELIETRLELDKAEWDAIIGRIPLPAPLPALREMRRGIETILSKEHDVLVEAYYQLQAVILDRDPKAQPTGEVARSPGDIDQFFARVRGT